VSSVVSAHGLSKSYRIPHLARPARVPETSTPGPLGRLLGRSRFEETAWVLDDVSFDIVEGEIVGVVGRNGSGKSTLLKILARIVRPTRGSATIRGRVGALIEVGTGFHPDLTGRENVFLNGTLLGMGQAEIRAKFDEIVEFAEIERFLDLPVKYYSSGMYTRLAFAVAAHLDPEILIVDEVLSVGDAEFQKKCLGKMGNMTRDGRTVFFVSHNMAAVGALCTRCLLLRHGRLVCDDQPDVVIKRYVEASETGAAGEVKLDRPAGEPPAYVARAALKTPAGDVTNQIEMGEDALLEVDYVVERPVRDVSMEILVSRNGIPLINSFDTDAEEGLREKRDAGRYRALLRLPLQQLKEGSYTIELAILWNRQNLIDPRAVLAFDIACYRRDLTHRSYRTDRPGQYAIDIAWNTQKAS
jgi:lipopolysaccharide transport system ATP-binding protein